MRIDKYLKVARILKRRPVAKELAEAGRLLVKDRPVRASYEVKTGDEITIVFGHRHLKVRVLDIKEHVKKEDTAALYEIIEDQKVKEDESYEQ